MQLESSLYLGSVENSTLHYQATKNNSGNKQIDANQAAEKFAALFIERMLNEIQPENSLITGERRSPSETLANQMMNQHLAEIISKNSELKQTFKSQIEKSEK